MAEHLKFFLAGHNPATFTTLRKSLGHYDVNCEYMSISEAVETLEFADAVLVDLDGSDDALAIAHRLDDMHQCTVATLSTAGRPYDGLLHLQRPVGYIDLQILLIRAGAYVAH